MEYQLSEAAAINEGTENWGTWTERVQCPKYYGIVGMNANMEEGNVPDDTALNQIKIICAPIDANAGFD